MTESELKQAWAEYRKSRRALRIKQSFVLTAIVGLLGFAGFSAASPYVLGKNVVGDGTFSSSTASGNNAFAATIDGARFDYGTGSLDYMTSDGTRIVAAGRLGVTDALEVPADTGTVYLNGTTRSVGFGVRGSGARIGVLGVLPLSPNTDQAINLGEPTVRWSTGYVVDLVLGTSTATSNISGAMNASTASTTVAPITLSPANALDANDLVFRIRNNSTTTLFTVDFEGDSVATGYFQGTNHYSTSGQFYNIGTTVPLDLLSDQNAATTSSTVPAARICAAASLDADDLVFAVGQPASCSTERFSVDAEGDTLAAGSLGLATRMHWSATAPTIASGGCTSPSVVSGADTALAAIVIGTSCSGVTDITLTLPTSTRVWNCFANTDDAATRIVSQIPTGSTTSALLRNFSRTTGLAADWTAGSGIYVSCFAGGG